MIELKWPDFKTFVDSKLLSIQEVELSSQYILSAKKDPLTIMCRVSKSTPDATDYETNYQPSKDQDVVTITQKRPSTYAVSLRIKGDSWSCPANTTTTHYVPLSTDYEIRGAEMQFVNGRAGDYAEVWVTDKDGAFYPAGTQIAKYMEKLCIYEHTPGSQAAVTDLVDDDTSDLIPGSFYLEIKYTNNQTAGSDDVICVVNFWLYERL